MNERTKALISAAVVIVVNFAAMYGISLDEGVLVDALCAIVDLVTMVYAIWTNHNFTFAAAQGQLVTDRIKNEQKALKNKGE